MRKIKFRGKFVYANSDGSLKWVYGDFGHSAVPGKAVINEINPYNEDNFIGHTEVLISTVGQFTGLHDKNDVEIYEGDIVKFTTWDYNGYDYQHKGIIKFFEGAFCVFENDDLYYDLGLILRDDEELEVIGNAIDNPELLKQ